MRAAFTESRMCYTEPPAKPFWYRGTCRTIPLLMTMMMFSHWLISLLLIKVLEGSVPFDYSYKSLTYSTPKLSLITYTVAISYLPLVTGVILFCLCCHAIHLGDFGTLLGSDLLLVAPVLYSYTMYHVPGIRQRGSIRIRATGQRNRKLPVSCWGWVLRAGG